MIPSVQDRVRLDWSHEIFLIVGVDYTRRKVDVAPMNGEFEVIADLPFDLLIPLSCERANSAAA